MKYNTLIFIIIAFSSMAQVPDTTVAVVVPPPVRVEKSVNLKDSDIIDFPDIEASFKGGKEGLQRYINRNLHYPEAAIENDEQGKVYVSFIVEKNGTVSHVKIERGVSKALDTEAKRVIESSPKWIPAKKGSKKVRSRCRLPISFTLT